MVNTSKNIVIRVVIVSGLFFVSCTSPDQQDKIDTPDTNKLDTFHTNGSNPISGSEIKENCFYATVTVPSAEKTFVTLPLGGIVDKLYMLEKQYVKKGSLLATVAHPEFIELQKKYLESKGRLKYLKEEFKRQGELTIEQASSIKNLQKTESEYITEEANMKGLSAQLKMIGIQPDSVHVDNLINEIKIFAPATGYITGSNAIKGKYVEPNQWLFEISSLKNVQLEFYIEPTRIHLIEELKVMEIGYPVLSESNTVISVNNWEVQPAACDRIMVIAHIAGMEELKLLPGMYIQCCLKKEL